MLHSSVTFNVRFNDHQRHQPPTTDQSCSVMATHLLNKAVGRLPHVVILNDAWQTLPRQLHHTQHRILSSTLTAKYTTDEYVTAK